MIELYANNAQTTIAGAISNTAVAVQLAPGAGALFPNPSAGQFFRMTFVDASTGLLREIVFCTARSGDVCTIQRAQEGTTALNWNAGDIAANFPTAGTMSNLMQGAQIQQGATTYAVDTGTANVYQATYSPAITALTDGMVLKFKAAHANTGASTFSPNGLTAQPIWGGDHAALTGGEIAANGDVWAQWNTSLNGTGAWVLIDSTGGFIKGPTPTTGDRSAKLATTQMFANEFASSTGYTKLPNGTLIQWGAVTVPSAENTDSTTTFPVAFQTACRSLVITDAATTTNNAVVWASDNINLANFTAHWARSGLTLGSTSRNAFYIAIGA